ncbi:MAG: fibronectin type III domain-containing protein [Patescibacteria group bacterium]
MPKKLIIGISAASVLVAAAAFAVVFVRSRALVGETSVDAGVSPDGADEASEEGASAPSPAQAGPCGDGVCSEGESWCKSDCGSEEDRFLGSIVATDVTPTSLTIGWKTSKPSTGEVSYGQTERYELGTARAASPSVTQEVRLTGLSPGVTYAVRVKATDADGKVWESDAMAFETPGR